jgi:hypothetical protein
MVAHACAFLHGAVLLEEAETQTDNIITNSTSTQTTTRTDETASQTNAVPEQRCAAPKTELPDDEHLSATENVKMMSYADASTQTVSRSNENRESRESNWKHGYGHCVSIEEGHLRLITEVVKAMALKEDEPIARNDISTQAAPTTSKTASQTNDSPECWCATIQTKPPDDESPTLAKNVQMMLHIKPSI